MASITFTLTQKGRPKLIDEEGNSYTRHSTNPDKTIEYWKCTVSICPGRYVYYRNSGNGRMSQKHLEGEHDDNPLEERFLNKFKMESVQVRTSNVLKSKKLLYNGRLYCKDKQRGVGLKAKVYWRCIRRTCKGRLLEFPIGTYTEKNVDHICGYDVSERVRDAALEKLKQLTLSASENVKAIHIVRKVLKAIPEHARHLMPSEDEMRRKVNRWARYGGIQLAKPSFEDRLATEEDDNQFDLGGIDLKIDLGDIGKTDKESHEQDETGEVKLSGENDQQSVPGSASGGLFFLKGRKVDGHYRVMIAGHIYHWKQGNRRKAVYQCREANIGCPVTATIIDEKEYEVHGEHAHDIFKLKLKQRRGKKRTTDLKRVDEDGKILGIANIDDVPVGGINAETFYLNKHLNKISGSQRTVNESLNEVDNYNTNDTMDDRDDHIDFDGEVEPEVRKIEFFKTTATEAVRSGERCFVCGDELVVSETLSSSAETFRKACCYLNVKSKKDWFPNSTNSQYYSFCEACTREITKIHNLYKNVEEIQSLIFTKVENVEKRIADAEIVDNWMADAPPSSAIRFEGFRKQVLINYRNKLKLRREIRVGKKMGHEFVEVRPVASVHMFASNPSETDAFRKVAPDCTPAIAHKIRVKPKSKQQIQEIEMKINTANMDETQLDKPPADFANDNNFDDSQADAWSEVSEKEVKFWQSDPSQLNLHEEFDPDFEIDNVNDDEGNDEDFNVDSDVISDPDSSDDEDWGEEKRRKRKRTNSKKTKSQTNASQSSRANVVSLKPERRARSMNIEFPDAILTKDNRIFMKGVEIVKLPRGNYNDRPDMTDAFSCGACGKIIRTFWKIRQHICGHHLGMYKCHVCDKEFTEPRVVQRHIESKHQERVSRPCEECGRPIFGNDKAMRYHRWQHLSKEEKNDPQFKTWWPPREKDPNRKKPQVYNVQHQCFQCGKTFRIMSALKRHELSHMSSEKVQCQYCGKLYAHKRALGEHVKTCTAHAGTNLRRFVCPRCSAGFAHRSALYKHLKRHDQSTPYSCPRCPRKFSSKIGYKNHKRICSESSASHRQNPRNVSNSDQGRNIDGFQPSTTSSSVLNDVETIPIMKTDPSGSIETCFM